MVLHIESIPVNLGLLNRLLVQNGENFMAMKMSVTSILKDALSALIQVILNAPWTKKKGKTLQKYIDNSWVDVSPSDKFQIVKVEAQCWIAIYNLLTHPDFFKKYRLTETNRSFILKVI
jgi:hypothetical protein